MLTGCSKQQRLVGERIYEEVQIENWKDDKERYNELKIVAEETRIKREKELRRLEEERRRKEIEERKRKANVGVDLDNVLIPSGITYDELYKVFIIMNKPKMAEISWEIVEAENITGINALFLAGLISNESGYGTSNKAVYQNNYTGFAVFNSKTKGSNFDSAYDCIIKTAHWLKEQYLSPGGKYFYGYSTAHVNVKYCLTEDGSATDYNWSTIINNISKTIESYYHKFVKEE